MSEQIGVAWHAETDQAGRSAGAFGCADELRAHPFAEWDSCATRGGARRSARRWLKRQHQPEIIRDSESTP